MEIELGLEAGDTEVNVDCGAFVQALLNVMENARKYAKSGGRLVIDSTTCNGQYQLGVRDFGPGIPETEREAIFQRFQRGADQRDGSIAGVGLGLYLARAILRAHGGDLSCEAVEGDGGGAQFRFTLPVAKEREQREEATS